MNRVVPDSKSSAASKSDLGEFGDQELPSSSRSVQVQDQLLDDETRALQVTKFYMDETFLSTSILVNTFLVYNRFMFSPLLRSLS